MPKKTLNINAFHGGLNTDTDPRDLKDNELSEVKGAYLDKLGRIRTSGSTSQYDSLAQQRAQGSTPTGQGLIQVGIDTRFDNTADDDNRLTILSSDHLLYIHDDGIGSFQTVDNCNEGSQTATTLQMHTGTMDDLMSLSHYYANNALRLSSLDSDVTSKWIGHIDNTYMAKVMDAGDGTIPGNKDWVRDGIICEPQYLAPPTDFFLSTHQGGTGAPDAGKCTNAFHDNHWDEILTANMISVALSPTTTTSNLLSESMKESWILGVSYCYDGVYSDYGGFPGCNGNQVQESNIKVCSIAQDSSQIAKWSLSGQSYAQLVQLHFKASVDRNDAVNSQAIGMNSRVSGMRLYMKEYEGEGLQTYDKGRVEYPWLRIADIDILLGNFKSYAIEENAALLDDEIDRLTAGDDTLGNTMSSNGAGGNAAECFVTSANSGSSTLNDATLNGIMCDTIPSESYYSLNGYKPDSLINCRYKTATVINNSAFIGNIYDITHGKSYNDRIIRTPKFKLDTFSTNFFVDVVPGDGDSIVHLENYADRLLVYKTNSLVVVNVAGENMFIEQQVKGLGIAVACQCIRTDIGVVWCNSNGVYMYNGSNVSNLTDNKIKTTWDSFYVESSIGGSAQDCTQIGFDPQSKHIVVLKSNNAGVGDCLIYDLKIKAWTYIDSLYTDAKDKTNFVTSVNNKLIVHEVDNSHHVLQYSDTSGDVASGAFSIKTKDFDFGNPHVRKKIYKVHITYKCNADTGVKVRFDTNGGTAFDKDFSASTSTNYGSLTLDTTSNVWARAELKPDNSSEVNNIYSFALQFISTANVDATFEINDITIIYRTKNVK